MYKIITMLLSLTPSLLSNANALEMSNKSNNTISFGNRLNYNHNSGIYLHAAIRAENDRSAQGKNTSLRKRITAKRNVAEKKEFLYRRTLREAGFKRNFEDKPNIFLYGRVNMSLASALKTALEAYEGPDMLITSGLRCWSKNSAHCSGNAVDIDWGNNGKEIVDYFLTEEGQAFLAEYNLEFFIEDSRSMKLSKKHAPFFRIIPHATGEHIHLNIKR